MFRKIFDPPIHRDHSRWIERALTEDTMCGEPADFVSAGIGCTAEKGHTALHAVHLSPNELYSVYSPDLATLSLPREELQGEIILVGTNGSSARARIRPAKIAGTKTVKTPSQNLNRP
jgi:hypothetical protein